MTRRRFLGAAVGTLGTGLLAGCRDRLPRALVPHSVPPDDDAPGIVRRYRTVCRECPAGCGATARVREGRAVMLEGSADHPISRGALCPRGQAAIEGLYSPGRIGGPRAGDRELPWEEAEKVLAGGIQDALDARRLVVVLTRRERGRLGSLFGAWLAALGQAPTQVVTFDAMERTWLREGQRRALGTGALAVPDLAAARLVLSIGDDLVEEGSPVEHARGLAEQRAAGGRFVYVGSRLSLTAAAADRWISVAPGSELCLVLGLVRRALELLGSGAALAPAAGEALLQRLAAYGPEAVAARTGASAEALGELASSLVAARPSLCLGPGRAAAGADAEALAEAVAVLNALLGNVGRTLRFLSSPAAPPAMDLPELARRAASGEVGALIVHHADPLGYGQAFAGLARAIARVPFVAAFGNELDATARRARLFLADHHFLESWSDVPVRPGIVGIQQPVMTPVLGTRAAADVLLAAARALGRTSGLPDATFGESVRQAYREAEIERGLRLEEAAAEVPALTPGALSSAPPAAELRGPEGGLPLVLAPTLRHLDGRAPRSALLQELPDPLTGYSWSGWVEMHPGTASAMKARTGDVIALEGPGGRVELPAFVSRTIRPGALAVPLGEATALLDARGHLGLGLRVAARPTGARVSRHHPEVGGARHGRAIVRTVSRSSPRLPPSPPPTSMYGPVEHPVHRWALAIDLDRCNGCSACSAACYVENNLAIIGPDQVARGRSMSWLPILAAVEEGPGDPRVSFLPLGCQHCDHAPCESVCPTFATYHTPEGINAQVYSRCVGTRYCENNCPYGVRRFNFYDWPRQPSEHLALNPDVTVRERGVTEKCTLCVQRIRAAEEQAKVEGRKLADGDVVSACAASCPTRAITFGDLRDPASEISRRAASGRVYRLLDELNTRPGVIYLARVREDPR